MKKFLALSFVLFALSLLFTLSLGAATPTSGKIGNCSWRVEDGVLTVSGNGSMGTSFNHPWGNDIVAAVIEEGVTDISPYAFRQCAKLREISLPSSLRKICDGAFIDCDSLMRIVIPEGVVSLGSEIFNNCSSLLEIVLPKSLSSLGSHVFEGCSELVFIAVNEGNNSFCSVDGVLFNKRMTRLIKYPQSKPEISYIVPDSVTVIDSYAFNSNWFLQEVLLHDHINEIGIQAFYYTQMLSYSNYKEDGVFYIGNYAVDFDDEEITDVTIRPGTRLIADYAFVNGRSIKKLYLPDGLVSIGTGAFLLCSELIEVYLPESLIYVGKNAFSECSSLQMICYRGSEEDAEKITYGTGNGAFTGADWQHYSCIRSAHHDFGPLSTVTPASCETNGLAEQSCRICGIVYGAVIPALTHDFSITSQIKAPTCMEAGISEDICSRCRTAVPSPIPMTGHTFGEYAVTVKPTFRKEGLKEASCAVCGARDSAPVPTSGASAVLRPLGIVAAVLAIGGGVVAICITAAHSRDDNDTVVL